MTGNDAQAGPADTVGLVHRYLGDHTASWAIGSLGAIGEFHHDEDESAGVELSSTGGQVITSRGALRVNLSPGTRAIAYEKPAKRHGYWHHGVEFCLSEGAALRQRRTVLTELGYDTDAIRREDRDSILFDIGLGFEHIEVLIRVSDHRLAARLGSARGRPFLDPSNPALAAVLEASPHRVFRSSLGRVEIYQAIPPSGGETPSSGPHTHILPDLLTHNRTHDPSIPIPDGLLPCLALFPANPVFDRMGEPMPFDRPAFDAFQETHAQFGGQQYEALKARVVESLKKHKRPLDPNDFDRFARQYVRVVLRQYAQSRKRANLETLHQWSARFDLDGS